MTFKIIYVKTGHDEKPEKVLRPSSVTKLLLGKLIALGVELIVTKEN